MNASDFQKKWAGPYQQFILSEMGRDFLDTLEGLRMAPQCEAQPHQSVYRLGGIAGYEDCIAKIKVLSVLRKEMVEPKQTYGHTEPPPPAKDAGDKA